MSQMRLTRRQWAGALAAAQAIPAGAQAAQRGPAQSDAPADLLAQAKQTVQRNREALNRFKIERSLEPAARFEA